MFDPVRVTKAVHLLGYVDSVAKLDDKFTGPVDLGGATAKWREGQKANVGSKAMLLVLDLSFLMDADDRLVTCKKSIKTILTRY